MRCDETTLTTIRDSKHQKQPLNSLCVTDQSLLQNRLREDQNMVKISSQHPFCRSHFLDMSDPLHVSSPHMVSFDPALIGSFSAGQLDNVPTQLRRPSLSATGCDYVEQLCRPNNMVNFLRKNTNIVSRDATLQAHPGQCLLDGAQHKDSSNSVSTRNHPYQVCSWPCEAQPSNLHLTPHLSTEMSDCPPLCKCARLPSPTRNPDSSTSLARWHATRWPRESRDGRVGTHDPRGESGDEVCETRESETNTKMTCWRDCKDTSDPKIVLWSDEGLSLVCRSLNRKEQRCSSPTSTVSWRYSNFFSNGMIFVLSVPHLRNVFWRMCITQLLSIRRTQCTHVDVSLVTSEILFRNSIPDTQ